MESKQTAILGHPTTIIVTEEGSSFFMRRNQRLQRYPLINGQEEYGLRLCDYSADSLRSMVAHGLIRKVQVAVREPSVERRDILTLLATITQGLLTGAFTRTAASVLSRSTVARQWNRQYPTWQVGSSELSLMARSAMAGVTERRASLAQLLHTRVRTLLRSYNNGRDPGSDSDAMIELFLAQLPEPVWFMLIRAERTPQGRELFDDTSKALARSVHQAGIGDYLGLVWLELLTHLLSPTGAEPDSTGEAQLLIQLQEGRMHLAAAAGDGQVGLLRADLDSMAEAGGAGPSLAQFWRDASDSASHLGLYYLGFLEDACRRTSVGFRSFAQAGSGQGHMVMSLAF